MPRTEVFDFFDMRTCNSALSPHQESNLGSAGSAEHRILVNTALSRFIPFLR